jgi:hypothetical protein
MAKQGDLPKRHKMVGWYDIRQLVPTGIRTAISTVFGEFADRRESIAAARAIDSKAIEPVYDYSKRADADGGFWFDFVADTGDGWNSTYAIARLLADPALAVEGMPRREGAPPILLMGGDQVYPAAGRDQYHERLIAPFDAAWIAKPRPAGERTPDLYAIPGNHDWYDGLSAFLGVFCTRRLASDWHAAHVGRGFGGRNTQQTRSYFALALPHEWWIWGVDVQLGGYIDQAQIDFFLHVARNWMAPGSRLIICTGNPEWVYIDADNVEKRFRNFDYVAALASRAERDHHLCAVLSGDSHHYSRYTENGCEYITAGGGGAFLHPTHQLPKQVPFDWNYPPPGGAKTGKRPYKRRFDLATDAVSGAESLFPSRSDSRALAFRDLAFPFLNWTFSGVMGATWLVLAWLLTFAAASRLPGGSLAGVLSEGSFGQAIVNYLLLILASPLPPMLLGIGLAGFIYFSDYKPQWRRWLAGILHGVAQFSAGSIVAILLARCVSWQGHEWLLIPAVGIGGGILAGFIFGIYLFISIQGFGAHFNEAFSALRVQGYKNFLRFRIDAEGALTIYPIGLVKVPPDRGDTLTNPPLAPALIETPIRVA